jgi:hypothetical protein
MPSGCAMPPHYLLLWGYCAEPGRSHHDFPARRATSRRLQLYDGPNHHESLPSYCHTLSVTMSCFLSATHRLTSQYPYSRYPAVQGQMACQLSR